MKEIRKLKANEIDCRVSQVSEKGLSLLLYKDARADMKVLDETFGAMNWKRSHQLIGDRLYCTVEVYDMDKKEWVAKQDVGTESITEAEKGQASDSFKRACTNFGIGRELYTAPFIWVAADKATITKSKVGKPACYDKFAVADIAYDTNGDISKLKIVNLTKKIGVYQYGYGK